MALPITKPGFSWIWFMLLAGLSLLAWISTYSGIMELISASSGEIGAPAENRRGLRGVHAPVNDPVSAGLDVLRAATLVPLAVLYCRLHPAVRDFRRLCFRLLLEISGSRQRHHAGGGNLYRQRAAIAASGRQPPGAVADHVHHPRQNFHRKGRNRARPGRHLPQKRRRRRSAPPSARGRRPALQFRQSVHRHPHRRGEGRFRRSQHRPGENPHQRSVYHRRDRLAQGLYRRREPQAGAGGDALQRSAHRSAAYATARRTEHTRRSDQLPRRQGRHVHLPRSAVAHGAGRRGARHQRAAGAAKAGTACIRGLGSCASKPSAA